MQVRGFGDSIPTTGNEAWHSVYSVSVRFKLSFANREKKQTMIDLRGIQTNWFKNQLKVVTSEKIGGSGVTSTLGSWYGGVVMGVLLSFNEAAILYRDFNSAPSQKQNIIVFAVNNSRCCECYVAPTIIL